MEPPSRTVVPKPAPFVARMESERDVIMNKTAEIVVAFDNKRGGATRAKRRLRAHAAEGPGQVRRLPALQQHHDDQEDADQDVNQKKKNIHVNSPV